MKIAIGSDHGGLNLKTAMKEVLVAAGVEVLDCGTHTIASVDYPDIAQQVATAVTSGVAERGILICGTGIGMSIAANKIDGIRAALCTDVFSALMSREHNDANILVLGERVTGVGHAGLIVQTWLTGEFQQGRHSQRVEKIMALEAGCDQIG